MKKFGLIVLGLVVLQSSLSSQIQKVRVGQTRYDLQTNNAVARRVALEPTTGELVITYTGNALTDSITNSNFPTRGTGHFYYSGTGSITPITGFPGRIESLRVGWGAPLFLANGKEMTVSHVSDGSQNGLYTTSRGKIGTGTWSEKKITNGAETWPRAANSGDSIIVISSMFAPSSQFGMVGGLGFKRSYDGGATWSPAESGGLDSIPGLNLATYPNITGTSTVCVLSADDYAIDVKGKKVAILTGGELDVTLFQSADFGNTWTKIPIVVGDNNKLISPSDTVPFKKTQSGGYSVIIDNNGKVHCFWASMPRNNHNQVKPTHSGIVYWNPSMTEPSYIGKTVYGKENGTHALAFYPLDGVLNFNKTANDLQRNYGPLSYSLWPNAGVDNSNVIYVTYSRIRGINDSTRINFQDMATIDPAVDKIIDKEGMLLHDVYLIKSTDGGSNWIGPLNVSNNDSMEDAYPSMARTVNSHVHIAYQQDALSGNALTASTTLSHKAQSTVNDIIYAKVPVSDIVMQSDNLPPMLKLRDEYFDVLKRAAYDPSLVDTFRFEVGCKKEIVSSLDYTNAMEFAIKYIAEALDDVTDQNLIKVDTTGLNMGAVGTYRFYVYARDASNKPSEIVGSIADPTFTVIDKTVMYHSWDTFKFCIKVSATGTSQNPPSFNWGTSSKKIFWLLGTPFTDADRPVPTVVNSNPCGGTISPVLPSSSLVITNTVGKYILPYSVSDGVNITRDTVIVYVGQMPTPVISDVNFVQINATTGKVYASAKSSTEIGLFSEYPDKYIWTLKKGTTSRSPAINRYKDTLIETITTAFKADNICVDISNVFTDNFKTSKKPESCTTFKNTLGVTSATSKDFQVEIYPNPSNGNFDIKIAGAGVSREVNIKISDIMGKKVIEGLYRIGSDGIVHIQGNHLVKGHYVIQTEVGSHQSSSLIEIR